MAQSASPVHSGSRRRLPSECVGCLAIDGVDTRVSTDHLEAQSREARLQLARNLLEGFGSDLPSGRLQEGNACSNAFHCAVGAFTRSLLQVCERVPGLRIVHSRASAAGSDDLSFQRGVQLPSRSAPAKSSISLRSCLS